MTGPRVLIAGLRGGSGKTLVALGLLAAWRKQGVIVAPFKKGPDYIDAAWLSLAAGRPCRNLDLYLMPPEAAVRSFAAAAHAADVSVIEGNRGLFDGMDADGSFSTAELAKLLGTPVILTVDCTKATRTIAAMVLGCQRMDPEVSIRGVILNRIGGARHEAVVRQSIETACGVPVLGALPRLSLGGVFPERHLGLLPPQEHEQVATPIAAAAAAVEEFLDLGALRRIARESPALAQAPSGESGSGVEPGTAAVVRIGVFRDAAFQFYYPENLEALTAAGAEIVDVSPIGDAELPAVDALYIGGGFPEMLAPQLSANNVFREQLRARIEDGLPVYAECGGTVYLGERLAFEGRDYPMVGALPLAFGFGKRPQGHGYVEVETVAENPYFGVGERLRGHEFHYTYVEAGSRPSTTELPFAFRVWTGFGVDGEHDGFCRRNVLASYTHLHALGVPRWAPALVRRAQEYRSGR